ncbi:MAG TPA: [FeFe] hydrogenase H-cluster maturation GTPase HydF [bacterium]|nr:[FeFe] hydrogenase H-cluster maturation GTPase HydF [bacterium]
MSQLAPRGLHLHIGIFGRRNAGKSSLLNALTRQPVAIVSPVAGTTTDPVEKPMELQPLGPVMFIDTAGVDDTGALGGQRIAKTRMILDRTDLGLLVVAAGAWSEYEEELLAELRGRKLPLVVVFNKTDLGAPPAALLARLRAAAVPLAQVSADRNAGIDELRAALVLAVPESALPPPSLLADLVPAGAGVVLVIPVDKEAPKGRIILPQQQAVRDVLDAHAWCLVVQDDGVRAALAGLRQPPALVVTDSQAFARVAADTPAAVPLTSFSILMARQKGDLAELARGARALDTLRPGDRVLIAEACTHHPIGEDIGRVKLPAWLRRHAGGELAITVVAGRDFPDDLAGVRLVINCGACMWNRREMLTRILRCRAAGVPITNYGMAIAATLGILDRALAPFPAALAAWRTANPAGG